MSAASHRFRDYPAEWWANREVDIIGPLISLPLKIVSDILGPRVKAWVEGIEALHKQKQIARLQARLFKLTGQNESPQPPPSLPMKWPVLVSEGSLQYLGMRPENSNSEWNMVFTSPMRKRDLLSRPTIWNRP